MSSTRKSKDGSSPLTRGKPHAGRRFPRLPGLIPAHAGKTCGRTGARTHARAHPRSRGENKDALAAVKGTAGSSPLTRGKLFESAEHGVVVGLIPAHAGKTAGYRTRAAAWRAHPRSRGENAASLSKPARGRGSSPLTRGKPGRRDRGAEGEGLIPAHAGKTKPRLTQALPPGAHPRSRGENTRRPAFRSPAKWLIPAHAGKTRPHRA